MATITSAASGNWSAGGTWVGGVAPTSADAAIIAAGHTVTLDGATCACLSLLANGALTHNAAVSTMLTTQKGIKFEGSSSNLLIDLRADPAIKCDIRLNASNLTTFEDTYLYIGYQGACTINGFARKRWSLLTSSVSAGQSSINVDDATGWQVGDTVVLAVTQSYSENKHSEQATIQSVSGGLVTFTAPLANNHGAGAPVGNFTSNVTIGSQSGLGSMRYDRAYASQNTIRQKTINHVAFYSPAHSDYRCDGQLYIDGAGATPASDNLVSISGCSFLNYMGLGHAGTGLRLGGNGETKASDCVAFTNRASQPIQYGTGVAFNLSCGDNTRLVNFGIGSAQLFNNSSARGIQVLNFGTRLSDSFSCGVRGGSGSATGIEIINSTASLIQNCYSFANYLGVRVTTSAFDTRLVSLGMYSDTGTAPNSIDDEYHGGIMATVTDFRAPNRTLSNYANASKTSFLNFVNLARDLTQQEVQRPYCAIKRNNAEIRSSASSIAIHPTVVSTDCQRTLSIPCANGASVRVVGYVKKSHATNIAATVAITGLGSSVSPFTKANDSAWEKFDLSATNSSGADGNFTLTYTANSSIGTANVAYFDGVPDSPFVTKCRHYGFLFDESSPVRTVDPYAVASEATATAYTGVTINGGTKRITFGAGTADTAQKFYDYSRAWCCTNLDKQVPFTRAGALLALATGWTVEEPSYSGVTWGGGNIEWDSPGSKSGAFDSCDMTFTAAGTYNFFNASIAGTVELINTSGGAVTVQLPAGASYTNTGPNITVTEPVVARGLDFNGVLPGSTVKVFATGTQTVIATPTSPDWLWTEATPGSVTVDYTIQRAGYLPIRVTGVTVTAAISGGVQTVQVQQIEAPAYVASSGLTFWANCFANPTTKRFGLTAASTLQNYYSRMMESWISEATLQNKPFPMVANGPNSFAFTDDWEWDLATYPYSIANLSRDGMKYKNAAGAVTAMWAAILTAGVPAGLQVRYQQSDGGLLGTASNTGNMDELLQIYGDATHGNFDRTDWLVLKVQAEGYDQAEAVHFDIYDQLDDQLYVYGLSPIPNGVAAGVDVPGIAVTSEVAPVEWPAASGKYFSTTIIDTAAPHSGLEILQAIRARNDFDMHDMIRPNGAKFKTVTGNLYGDYLITPAGVRVVMNDGVTPHPDFDLFSDDTGGNPYVPPVIAQITWAGALNATTVLLYNDSDAGAIIDTQVVSGAGGYTWSISLPHAAVAVGDSLRLRFGNKAYYAGELQGTMTATGLAFVGTMTPHPVYAGWGLNGSAYDQANGGPYTMDGLNLEIDIGGGAGTGSKKELAAWTQHLMTLPAGLDAFYGAWDLLDLNLIRQNVSIANVLIDKPTAGQFVFTDNDVNYYRSDFSIPYNTAHSTIFMTYNAKPFIATVTGSNVITGDISTVLAAIPAASENATAVRTELATELARIDAPISTRLPTVAYTAPDNAGIADIDAKTEALAAIQAKTDQLTFTSGKVQSDMRMAVGQSLKGDGSESDKIRSTLVP